MSDNTTQETTPKEPTQQPDHSQRVRRLISSRRNMRGNLALKRSKPR